MCVISVVIFGRDLYQGRKTVITAWSSCLKKGFPEKDFLTSAGTELDIKSKLRRFFSIDSQTRVSLSGRPCVGIELS